MNPVVWNGISEFIEGDYQGLQTSSVLQIADPDSVVLSREQAAIVTFTNPFSYPVSGVLTVAGAGLIQGKVNFR